MKLARAAARTWRTHRDALRAIAADEREPSRLLLTGGSVLNADWGHRESIVPELRSTGRAPSVFDPRCVAPRPCCSSVA